MYVQFTSSIYGEDGIYTLFISWVYDKDFLIMQVSL